MWYFAWMLGLPLAVMFGVINALWLETHEDRTFTDEIDRNMDA